MCWNNTYSSEAVVELIIIVQTTRISFWKMEKGGKKVWDYGDH